jgi:hypothetical protein
VTYHFAGLFHRLRRAIDRIERAYYDLLTWGRRRRWARECEYVRDRPEEVVPKDTVYCYEGRSYRCPFWRKAYDLPDQNNGYCAHLRWGDWQGSGTGLLWDQVKECGINEDGRARGVVNTPEGWKPNYPETRQA